MRNDTTVIGIIEIGIAGIDIKERHSKNRYNVDCYNKNQHNKNRWNKPWLGAYAAALFIAPNIFESTEHITLSKDSLRFFKF